MVGFFSPQSLGSNKGVPQRITQCGKCGLSKKCISPKIEPAGSGKYKILFISDAPDETEDQQGRQFIGESGKLIRQIIKDIGFNINDCLMTNSIICRTKKVEPYMISCCRPALLTTIKKLKPNVIITLGNDALEAILNGIWAKGIGSVRQWAGMHLPSAEHNAWVCPTYHPRDILRQEKDVVLRLTFTNHLRRAFDLVDEKPNPVSLSELESKVEIIRSTRKAKYKLRDLATKSGYLAFDYETTGLKPENTEQRIFSVSFCLNGEYTFAFKMKHSLKNAISAVLQNPELKKIAANAKFEERWTQKKIGHSVKGWHWDTMLAAHCLDNRSGISSLKFQAFVLLGLPDYDIHISPYLKASGTNELNRIIELDTNELLLYNGLDSLVTYKIMQKQKELMERGMM